MPLLRRIAATLATAAVSCAHAAPAVDRQYFNLDSDRYFSTNAADFCGGGKVAGTTLTADWVYAAFVTDLKGEVSTYSVPGSTYTEIMGCYQSQLMGQTIVGGVRSGFYQTANGDVQLVAPEGGAYPTVEGMNASGTVVGWYMPLDKDNVRASGFIIRDGEFSRFDIPGKPDTRLSGVLDDGTLYGTYMKNKPLRATGFIIRDGVQTDIHIIGSYDTVITGMNKSGRVVGYFSDAIGSPYQGFVWEAGKYTKFSFSREGGATYPLGIDAKGNVVGYVTNPDYSQASFVARPAKKLRD